MLSKIMRRAEVEAGASASFERRTNRGWPNNVKRRGPASMSTASSGRDKMCSEMIQVSGCYSASVQRTVP